MPPALHAPRAAPHPEQAHPAPRPVARGSAGRGAAPRPKPPAHPGKPAERPHTQPRATLPQEHLEAGAPPDAPERDRRNGIGTLIDDDDITATFAPSDPVPDDNSNSSDTDTATDANGDMDT